MASARGDDIGVGVLLLVLGVMSFVYAFTSLGSSEQAGWLLPGPAKVRKPIVAISGACELICGVAFLAGWLR